VTSVGDTNIGKVLVLSDGASGLTTNNPGGVGSGDEAVLARPLHLVEHGISTEMVANEVIFTVVENDGDLSQKPGNQVQITTFEIINEVLIDSVRAGLPSAVTNAQLGADSLLVDIVDNRVKVVAQSTIALLTDIINVDVTSSTQDDGLDLTAGVEGAVVVTRVDIRSAGFVLLLSLVHDTAVNEAVGIEIRSIAGSLDQWVSPAVTDGNTLQVDATLAEDVGSNGRDVVSSIRLTSDVERQASVLRVLLEEVAQEGEEISGDLSLISHIAVAVGDIGKAGTAGAVNVEQVGKGVPTKWVSLKGEIFIHSIRAILKEQR